MKSVQNEKVAKTIGENKNFEGRMVAKTEIIKKRSLKGPPKWQKSAKETVDVDMIR